jgi:hypothetical protein
MVPHGGGGHRESANPDQVKLIHRRSETGWEKMTFSQKTVDFTARHQFSVIAGCWALGIAGAFGTIIRNPCACNHNGENESLTDFFMICKISKLVTKGNVMFGAQLILRNHGSLHS